MTPRDAPIRWTILLLAAVVGITGAAELGRPGAWIVVLAVIGLWTYQLATGRES